MRHAAASDSVAPVEVQPCKRGDRSDDFRAGVGQQVAPADDQCGDARLSSQRNQRPKEASGRRSTILSSPHEYRREVLR